MLHIRQSTLSLRLRKLEQRLGTPLFERSNSGTRLTVAGEEFVTTARHIGGEVETAFARFKTRGRGENGDIVLGISPSAT